MNIGIVGTDRSDWTCSALAAAAETYGAKPVVFSLRDVTSSITGSARLAIDSVDLTALDAIVVRDVGAGGLDEVAFRFDVLNQLAEHAPVFNSPEAIQKAANKYVSSVLFQKHGLPVPRTIATHSLEEAKNALSMFGKAVVKPLFGYKGIGIVSVCDDDEGKRQVERMLSEKGMLYIQEFIHNPGRDIRAFVVNGEVAGAMYRIAPEGSWINNLSRGGRSEACELTGEQEELSAAAAECVGADFAGVDLMEDGHGGQGTYVIEVNGTPSGKGIFESCGTDVASLIMRHVLNAVRT